MSQKRAGLLLVALTTLLVACVGGDDDDCMNPLPVEDAEIVEDGPLPMTTHTFGHPDDGGC